MTKAGAILQSCKATEDEVNRAYNFLKPREKDNEQN
jgi:hypothetical protein